MYNIKNIVSSYIYMSITGDNVFMPGASKEDILQYYLKSKGKKSKVSKPKTTNKPPVKKNKPIQKPCTPCPADKECNPKTGRCIKKNQKGTTNTTQNAKIMRLLMDAIVSWHTASKKLTVPFDYKYLCNPISNLLFIQNNLMEHLKERLPESSIRIRNDYKTLNRWSAEARHLNYTGKEERCHWHLPKITVKYATDGVKNHVTFAMYVQMQNIQTRITAVLSSKTYSLSILKPYYGMFLNIAKQPIVIEHSLAIKEISIPNPTSGKASASIRFDSPLTLQGTEWASSIPKHRHEVSILQKSFRSERQYDVNTFVDKFLGFRPKTITGPASISPEYNSDENSNYENNIEYPSKNIVKYQNRRYSVTSQEGQRLIRDYMVKGRKLPVQNETKKALDRLQQTEHKYVIHMHGITRSDHFVIPDNVYISLKTLPGSLAWTKRKKFRKGFFSFLDNNEKNTRFSTSYADSRKKEYKVIHFPGDTIQNIKLTCKPNEGKRCGAYKYPYIPSGSFTDDIGMKYNAYHGKYTLKDHVNIMVEKIRPTKENPLAIYVTSCRRCSSDETYEQAWKQNAAARQRMGIQTIIPPDLNTTTRTGMGIFKSLLRDSDDDQALLGVGKNKSLKSIQKQVKL